MNFQDKTREELIIELNELQQKYDSCIESKDRNASENKQSLQDVYHNEHFYSQLFDLVNEGLLLLTPEGKIADINQSFARMHGYTVEELKSMDITELDVLKENTFAERSETLQRLYAGEVVRFDVAHYHKQGHILTFSNTVSLITVGGQQFFLAFHQDIAERKKSTEIVKENEIRFREVLENSLDASYKRNLLTNSYDYLSPVFEQITGYSQQEMNTMPLESVLALIHPDDIDGLNNVISGALKQPEGKENRIEYRFVHKYDGSYRWLLDKFVVMHNEEGHAVSLIGSVSDITKQKLTEEALHHSQDFVNSIIEKSPASLWISDEHGTLIRINQACRNILHLQDEEVVGKYNILKDNIIEEQGFMPLVRDVFDKGATVRFVMSYDTAAVKSLELGKSSRVDLDVSISPIIDLKGKVTNAIIQHIDITERRQAELRLRRFWDFPLIGMAITSPDKRFLEVNQKLADMLGYTPKELAGMPWPEITHPDDLAENIRLLNQVLAGETDEYFLDKRFIRRDGKLFYSHIAAHCIRRSDGSVDHLALIIQDITERKQNEQLQNESEEKFRSITEQTSDRIAITDTSGIVIYASSASKPLFQFDPEEMCGRNFIEFVDKPDIPRALAVFMDAINSDTGIRNLEFSMKRKDGSIFTGELNGSKFLQGNIRGTLVTIRDISERKQAEEKIRAKDIQFRKLSANVSDLIFQFTRRPDGTYYVPIASEGIRNIFGCSPEDVLDDFTPIGRVIYPDDADRVISDIEYSAEHLTYFTCEFRVQIPGKEIQWIFSRSTPEKLPDGSTTWYGFNADITDRKRAEEQLKHLSARLSLAVRTGGVGVWDYDIVHNTLVWDDQMFALYGINKNDFGGVYEAWRSGLHFEDAAREDAEIQMAIRGEKEFDSVFRVVWPDGSIHTIRALGSVQRNLDGQAVRIIGTNWDITDQRRAELELILAKEHAEESDRLKSACLANMSHEIRTPMNGILGFAELLKEPDLSGEQQKEYIRIIEKSGTRMLNIINDIVDISKIEAGLMKLDIKESNFNEQIEYIYTFFKPQVEEKGMKLLFKNTLPAKEANIRTDKEKVYSILTNLVKNAIKYSSYGTIEFGYIKKDETLEVYVKDTGIGIRKDRQEAIFERFIQADINDKMARQGAGLGLSISKAYVEMLGGKIWVVSEEGFGTTFYFTLPYNAEPKEKIIVQNNLPPDKTELTIKNLKILIAEDDETSETLLGIGVKSFGKEVLIARTGAEAVEICRTNPDIDLILMDIQLPVMSGYEATQQIREFNKEVVIIAQTAYALTGDKEKALEAGCDNYITKPISKVALLSLMQLYFGN
jgi:PAS domain S-box-containing protein